MFEKGETTIARVFMADTPPTVILVNNNLLSNGAEFKQDERYTLNGKRNYGKNAVQVISQEPKKR
jgi:hypothetical protein